MSYTMEIPKWPTHTIKHRDNLDGEGDICVSLAFMVDGDYYHFSDGSPVCEYAGDEILKVWKLTGIYK